MGLYLSCGSDYAFSECDQVSGHVLACGIAKLSVNTDFPGAHAQGGEFHGLSREWPQGLTIEAGIITGSEWAIVTNLADRMNLKRWIRGSFLREDSLWRATGKEMSEISKDTTWRFTFEIPEDLVGQQLFFKATYEHPVFGTLVNSIPAQFGNKLTIVEPCSQKDRDRALGSAIVYANLGGDFAQALLLADSLIPLGWRDLAGLEFAAQAAEYFGDLEKSIEYMDLNFQANGRIRSYPSTPSPRDTQIYRQRRESIMQTLQEQQQQQR